MCDEFSSKIDLTGTAKTVNEGVQLISVSQPGLVFLDVPIRDKTGFDLLRQINEINFEVIFTTAYDKYAIQAIKFSALDYPLKPINKEELEIAISKHSGEVSKKITVAKMDTLLHNPERKNNGLKKSLCQPIQDLSFWMLSTSYAAKATLITPLFF